VRAGGWPWRGGVRTHHLPLPLSLSLTLPLPLPLPLFLPLFLPLPLSRPMPPDAPLHRASASHLEPPSPHRAPIRYSALMWNRIVVLLSVALLAVAPGESLEGKWTPDQLLELDRAWLTELGLELDPAELWSPDGGGLLEAVVDVGGCSGALVSRDGLVVTNHHCVFSVLQQHSSPDRDLIRDGFVAPSRQGELQAEGVRVGVPHRFVDVTADVLAAVPDGVDDLARFHSLERRRNELVAECEARPHRRCSAAEFDHGVRYVLVETVEYPDIRLVWAPPNGVGDFGGEVDNWSWPRHGGDVALLRVWADPDNQPAERTAGNRPFRPARSLEVSTDGVSDGRFVMVAGYPGRTVRSLVAAQVALDLELRLPARSDLYRAWLDIMGRSAATDDQARIALASRMKGLANGEKAARGQVEGARQRRLLERKRSAEAELLHWAAEHPEHAAAVAAHRELVGLAATERDTAARDLLLDSMRRGSLPLAQALTLVRWARERARPDVERLPGYQDRDRDRLEDRLRTDAKRLHLPTDAELLADLVSRFADLPADHGVAALAPLEAPGADGTTVIERCLELLAGSPVVQLDRRLAMLDEDVEALRTRRDPLLDLAFALDDELRAREERDHRLDGALSRLVPVWRRAMAARRGGPLDPDANGTLRASLARVAGYSPRDAVWMHPRTTLRGALAKHTGTPPFDLPAAIRAAAGRAAASRFADRALADLPVDFLADADTTGGNSGSPVLDGRGRLVGVNFDRVWENVANDFGHDPAICRSVAVDIRYVLWLLDQTEGAGALLTELGAGPAAR